MVAGTHQIPVFLLHHHMEPPRRPRPLALALVLVALVVAPAALLVTEVQLFDLKPTAVAAGHMLRSYLTPSRVDCSSATPLRDDCIVPLLKKGEFQGADTTLYPEEIFQVDWSEQVTRADVLHLGALQAACMAHTDSVVPWNYGVGDEDPNAALINRTEDQALLDALRQCPSFDVYIPGPLRGQGYCEDAAAYTKYAHARMVPRWVFEVELFDKTLDRKVKYHELCPRTPLVVFNHYWDGLRDEAAWPKTKPLFLMPNIEMFELEAEHYWQADVVLCKTVICADYLAKWFEQQGNPKLTRVLYTRHTTSDVATSALVATGVETPESDWHDPRTTRKNFAEPVFVHTAGSSSQKGTARVFDCWLSRPDLPQVDVYMSESLYKRLFRKSYDARLTSADNKNIKLHLGSLDGQQFGTMIADTSFFLCTSRMEGYGHYINQARAAGGLILTPDVPPMNELVTRSSGVLVDSARDAWARHFLGGASKHVNGLRNVTGFVSRFGGTELCAAVDKVLTQMDASARAKLAQRARQQYLYDTAFFALKMQELRVALRPSEKDTPQ